MTKNKIELDGVIYEKIKPKEKQEFSKGLTVFLIVFGVLCIIASYALAFMNNTSVNEGVTIAVITQILTTQISYFTYQYKLKDSRNKNAVDDTGVPFAVYDEEDWKNYDEKNS